MVRRIRGVSAHAVSAAEIWRILIDKANNRQTVTYGELSNLIGRPVVLGIGVILDHVGHYCRQNNLPPLTALVVNRQTGQSGPGWERGNPGSDQNDARQQVFGYNWSDIVPPTPEELREALQAGQQNSGRTRKRSVNRRNKQVSR
jgi:putative restriction endonuclease